MRPAGSGDRFEPLPAAPAGGRELRARWDSDAYPAGEYEFRAIGYDAAGNAATTTRRANGERDGPLQPAEGDDDAARRLRRASAAATDRPLRPRRRSSAAASSPARCSPLDGVPVRIVERFAAGAQPGDRVSTVRTGAGRDASRSALAPGPSRTSRSTFERRPTLTRSASRPLRLGVRSGVRLRASSGVATVGGAPLVFSGRVAAAPGAIPPGGKSVQLQFRLPGLPWAEFRTIQTDRRGRFRYAYRFSDDDSRGARFQFRAYAPAQRQLALRAGGLAASHRARALRASGRLAERRMSCIADLIDQALGARGLLSIALRTRCSTSLRLRFRVVSTRRCRLRASRSTRLRVLRASVVALRRALAPRRSVRFTVRRSWVP